MIHSEDLYMGGSFKIWREKNAIKPVPGKRRCKCRNEVYHRQIGPGMFQQMTEQACIMVKECNNEPLISTVYYYQVCEQCQNVKYEREGYYVTVDMEKGIQDGQGVNFFEDGEPKINGEPGDLKNLQCHIKHTDRQRVRYK